MAQLTADLQATKELLVRALSETDKELLEAQNEISSIKQQLNRMGIYVK